MRPKKFLMLVASLLMIGVAITVYIRAGQGQISIENESGQTIHRLAVTIDNVEVFTQQDFQPEKSVRLQFNARSAGSISVRIESAWGSSSTGTIEPGAFADIQATIEPDGDIGFGDTRFSNACVRIGDWN